jgi:Holliday junction resolvase-like predicted endonuclease
MQNIGEEITGAWLQVCEDCEFIQYNLQTPDIQGEIDVIGINTKQKILYICEVAIHLVTGMQYVKNNQPDNVAKFLKKLNKDIDYAEKYFPDYTWKYMLWSPIVKD